MAKENGTGVNPDMGIPGMVEFAPIPTITDTRPSIDIINSGERARRLEMIPLEYVITETPVIDPVHASELAADIKREQQLMPILVRGTVIDGELAYQIADGFHRSSGMKAAGEESIEAFVMYGWSYVELLNKRILSANSVKSVKFGRLAMWMQELYEMTPWHDMGIGMSEAVTATVFKSPTIEGKAIGNRDMSRLQEWVNGQARNWQMTTGELWESLGTIEQSDPRLVHLVRPTINKGDEHSFILESHLKAASEAYPGKSNYPIQRALINWVLENKITPTGVDRMAADIRPNLKPGMKARDVTEVILGIAKGWEFERQHRAETRARQAREAAAREERYDREPLPRSSSERGANQRPNPKISQAEELKRLKWWEATDGLEDGQRELVRLVLGEARRLTDVEESLGIAREQAGIWIVDAIAKRDIQK